MPIPNKPTPTVSPTSTMTNAHAGVGPLDDIIPDSLELSDDIVAKPLNTPEFMEVRKYLKQSNVEPRWIFKDPRRYSQAVAQGYRVANKNDFKPGFASPYFVEGDTKLVNGDLILMLIDRGRYLGALKHKHRVAAALSDAAIQRGLSARRAVADINNSGAMRASQVGQMDVFTPGAADLRGTPFEASLSEAGRLGGDRASDDMGAMPIR